MTDLDDISGTIVDAALQLHRDLGPGLLESVYEAILARALAQRGLHVERQKRIPIEYHGMVFDEGFRADLIVETRVLVEIKSLDQFGRQHAKQLLTYLKLTNLQVGLLINFGAPTLRDGLRRVVNRYEPSAFPRLRVNQGVPHRDDSPAGSSALTPSREDREVCE